MALYPDVGGVTIVHVHTQLRRRRDRRCDCAPTCALQRVQVGKAEPKRQEDTRGFLSPRVPVLFICTRRSLVQCHCTKRALLVLFLSSLLLLSMSSGRSCRTPESSLKPLDRS
eukprot:3526487-Rhodomonas_salina.2